MTVRMDFDLQPYLDNELVLLRPLKESDFEDLFKVASDPLIWKQHQNKDRHTLENFTSFFEESITSKGALVILDTNTNSIIGSSRFKIIDEVEGVVEIGWSFLGRVYWGGQYNRSFKKLMIHYALQHYRHIVFYVDSKNNRSQRAVQKIGGKRTEDMSKPWVLPKQKGVTFVIDTIF